MSDVLLYRWVNSLSTGPGFLVFLARGWSLEWIDERFWSVLIRRSETQSVLRSERASQTRT